ncbi:MAG: hypothetical protein AAFY06_00240 [Pseudomonadota bacterium]
MFENESAPAEGVKPAAPTHSEGEPATSERSRTELLDIGAIDADDRDSDGAAAEADDDRSWDGETRHSGGETEGDSIDGPQGSEENGDQSSGDRPDQLASEAKPQSRAQQRIRQLANQLRESRERLAFYQQQAQQADPGEAPDPLDYADNDEYMLARQRHMLKGMSAEDAARQAQQAERVQSQVRQQVFETRVEAADQKTPGLAKSIRESNVEITPVIAATLQGMDQAPQIAHFLATNPQAAEVINRGSPQEAFLELGRIDSLLRIRDAEAPPRSVTKTPAPVKRVTRTASPKKADPVNMSDEDFDKWMGTAGY